MNEERNIRMYQVVVIGAAALLIVLMLVGWYVSGPGQEWRKYQRDYLGLAEQMTDSLAMQAFAGFRTGVAEYDLPELNVKDRCVTCHTGIANPYMKDAPQPFTAHPGKMFEHHPPDEYGCTICHGGQGRALNTRDAHGIALDTHWDHPLLSYPYNQSSCGKCHLSIFSGKAFRTSDISIPSDEKSMQDENQSLNNYQAGVDSYSPSHMTNNFTRKGANVYPETLQRFDDELSGMEIFHEGHAIFNREGCLGCHKARGVGGIIGPDLTEQGEKTRHEYSFQNLDIEQTVSNWLKEHFRDPEMVSPGSQMLKIDLPEAELDALTTFVLGLARPDIDFHYFSLQALNEFKGNRAMLEGQKLFGMACAACHGKEGEGKDYEEYKTGVPGIGRRDFLRVASTEYIDFTLDKGRSLRQMASWEGDISGLERSELDSLIRFIQEHNRRLQPEYSRSMIAGGSVGRGKALFANHCATCHGKEGNGGIAMAVNREDFLKYADDAYLYNTLVTGRDNATMPSWEYMETADLASLVRYIRSFGGFAPRTTNVRFPASDPSDGRLKYRFLCMRCHGEAGEGQTGPAIINKDFLEVASDDYLYNTIAYGRGHTAMFGWSVDVYNNERLDRPVIGNIVAYMRETAAEGADYIYAGANPGDRQSGEGLYRKHCAECHGNDGEGEKGPALNNQELLNAASNGYLVATITVGREGTKMPAWGGGERERVGEWESGRVGEWESKSGSEGLSAKERQDIVAWMRGWERIRIGF